MAGAARLPEEAFDYYIALGASRSYAAVARHFAVAKRTVSRHAKADDWQGRIVKIERDVRERTDAHAAGLLETAQVKHLARIGALQDAIYEVLSPQRMKAITAALVKAAVSDENVAAARLLIDRVLGRPRTEALSGLALDLPDGLETASDVRTAANAILQALSEGSIAPEDAQKAAVVLESARRSVETLELERRIEEIEARMKEEKLT